MEALCQRGGKTKHVALLVDHFEFIPIKLPKKKKIEKQKDRSHEKRFLKELSNKKHPLSVIGGPQQLKIILLMPRLRHLCFGWKDVLCVEGLLDNFSSRLELL